MATTVHKIQGYAQALFAVAQAEGSLQAVEDELYRFAKTVDAQPELRDALADPALPTERKKALIQDLLGERADRHTVSLLGFLVEQGRAADLSKIIEVLAEMAASEARKSVAEVRTAVPLDAKHRKALAEALAKATGKDVELKVLVDPSVMGGVVARVGDQVFDGTIRRKLEMAREQLTRAR